MYIHVVLPYLAARRIRLFHIRNSMLMKKRLSALILCFVFIISFIPATSFAYDFGVSNYNDNDFNKLQAFLNLISDDGVHTNGYRLNPLYNQDDPSTWGIGTVVYWTSGNTDKRVIQLLWGDSGLKGDLDLSGFTSLTYASLQKNPITSVNVSGDVSLQFIGVGQTDITELNTSGLTTLNEAWCNSCPLLTSVDTSGCTSLTDIFGPESQIETLNVTGCTSLSSLTLNNNKLAGQLDFGGLTSLKNVDVNSNMITELGLGGCTALEKLSFKNNNVSSLDVSALTSLKGLYCEGNTNLASLTITGASSLTAVECPSCALTDLDASGLTSLESLDCGDNDIETLDVTGDTALTGLLCVQNNLTDIIGLGDATGLKGLMCSGNAIDELDVSGMTELVMLVCDNNELEDLDLSGNSELFMLVCDNNKIDTLNIISVSTLAYLSCRNNLLTTLDLSGFTALIALDLTGNRLSFIKAVFSGTHVTLTAKGGGYVELYNVDNEGGAEYYANAVAIPGEGFINWTDETDTQIASIEKYDLSAETEYNLTANFTGESPAGGNTHTGKHVSHAPENALTSNPADGTIYTGGRITLTPSTQGGTWDFDKAYLTRDGYRFTGLKEGTTRLTYTVGGTSAYFDVTILQSELPKTGQDFTLLYLLFGMAGLFAGTALLLNRKIRE